MNLIKLKPRENNLFHIGEKDLQSTEIIIHSDTLFSAVCNNYRLIYGKKALDIFLELKYKELRLSSAFHYIDVYEEKDYKGTIFFLPKPFIKFEFDEDGNELKEKEPKLFKNIEFISVNTLIRWNKSGIVNLKKKYILDKKYLIDEEDYALLGLNSYNEEKASKILKNIKIAKESEEQKVVVDRFNNRSDTFYQSNFGFSYNNYYVKNNNTKTDYAINAGFYFLANLDELSDKELFAAVKLIQDHGIGGERSSGKGLFEKIEVTDLPSVFKELIQSKQNNFMSLSLIFPEEEEVSRLGYYSLIERRGFIYSDDGKSLRRKTVRMLEEGSIFNEEINGKIPDVTPDTFKEHEVYRYGLAFLVPIRNGVDQNVGLQKI